MADKFTKVSKFKTGDNVPDNTVEAGIVSTILEKLGIGGIDEILSKIKSRIPLSDAEQAIVDKGLMRGQKPLGKWSPISTVARAIGNIGFNPEQYKVILRRPLMFLDSKGVPREISLENYLRKLSGDRRLLPNVDFVSNLDNKKVLDEVIKFNSDKLRAEIAARAAKIAPAVVGAPWLYNKAQGIMNPDGSGAILDPFAPGQLPNVYGPDGGTGAPGSGGKKSPTSPGIEDFMPFKDDKVLNILSRSTPVASELDKFIKIAQENEMAHENPIPQNVTPGQAEGLDEQEPQQNEQNQGEIIDQFVSAAGNIPTPDVVENIIATALQQGNSAAVQRYLVENLLSPYGQLADAVSSKLGTNGTIQ